MGWFWEIDSSPPASSDAVNISTDQQLKDLAAAVKGICATTKVERTHCETKFRIQRGKFVRKCENTKEIHFFCPGESFVHKRTEYTEANLSSLHGHVEDEKVIAPANVGIQLQMKSLLEAAQDVKNTCKRRSQGRK